jgi:SAM-dependent methyltransferase
MQKLVRVFIKPKYCVTRFLSTVDGKNGSENMSTKIFWEQFYKKNNEKPFEWLMGYDKNVLDFNKKQFKDKLVLESGCGNSLFSIELLKNEKSFLICADFSADALKQLHNVVASTKRQSVVDFVLCDCANLPFRDDIYDIVIDKGYLDSLLKSKNMKYAMDSLVNMIDKLDFTNEHENLKESTCFLMQITDEQPELRIDLFDRISKYNLRFYYKEIFLNENENQSYFIYFLSKLKK